MRRGIWVGAAVLIAVVAAIPVWLALDDGAERNQAALTESTKTAALDCSRAKVRGCPELNQALAALDAELAGDQRAAEIEALQTSIKQNSFYKAGVLDTLSDQETFDLQQASALALGLAPEISPATGQRPLALRLVNRSRSPCLLDGYPVVRLSDSAGAVPFLIRHGGDQMIISRHPQAFLIRPGRAAFVILNHYRCDRGNGRARPHW